MKETIITTRNTISRFLYQNLVKPIFFLFDPEGVRDRCSAFGKLLGLLWLSRLITGLFFSYSNKKLEQEILGIKFNNPIGLAAGFDKNGELADILPSVGFGFMEMGLITGEPCEGNPKPRLWRLKKSISLVRFKKRWRRSSCQNHRVHGFICTNQTKNRKNKKILEKVPSQDGGMSGKVVENLSNELISYLYKKTKGKYVTIGLGGVFTAKDAYKKIKLGASLVQLITGMIYEGPQVISEINQGLVKLLDKDGYSNISEAIGTSNKL